MAVNIKDLYGNSGKLESFTWIPIQILYIHGHFKDYAIWNHMY